MYSVIISEGHPNVELVLYNTIPHTCTVLHKGKLTVLTRNSILDPRSFREWKIEFRGSSFDFRGSRIKFQGLSFETLEEFFEDLEQRFRGNDLILENKTIAMNKTINAQLPLFARVVHFLQEEFSDKQIQREISWT